MANINFNNAIDKTLECIQNAASSLSGHEATIIRDIFGCINVYISKEDKRIIESRIKIVLGKFIGKIVALEEARFLFDEIEKNRILIERIRDDYCIYLLERPIAKKSWLSSRRLNKGAWEYYSDLAMPMVVTFYSFKGGMGRTTALIGTALSLVKHGKNVAIVDFDIEAPGLGTIFGEFDHNFGLVDYLIEKPILGNDVDLKQYYYSVNQSALLGENDGKLYVFPAGKMDENYLQKLARIDYQDMHKGQLVDIFKLLLSDIRLHLDNIDFILLDSRSGFNDMAGHVLIDLPHGVVLFGSSSEQSWQGVKQVIGTIQSRGDEALPILMIDSMGASSIEENGAEKFDLFIEKSHEIFEEIMYDDQPPARMAKDAMHYPILVPWNKELREQMCLFYSDNKSEHYEKLRIEAWVNLLTSQPYQEIAERILNRFKSVY